MFNSANNDKKDNLNNGESNNTESNNNNSNNPEFNNDISNNYDKNYNEIILDVSSLDNTIKPLSPVKSKTRSPFKFNRNSSSSSVNT